MRLDEYGEWLDRYVEACVRNDPTAVDELFAPAAVYWPEPFGEPWRGRDEIRANWIEDTATHAGCSATATLLAMAGEVAVADWWASYPAMGVEYRSAFVMRFDGAGRCTEFREWYVARDLREAGVAN